MGGRETVYTFKKGRRTGKFRVAIGRDAALAVTAPWFVPVGLAESFLRQKESWILHQLDFWQKRQLATGLSGNAKDYKRSKAAAYRLAVVKIKQWNVFYGLSYCRVSIRNQKTRWGSCSQKGNLNFNYKIIHLAEHLQDYLIVHELCHLRQPNHSKDFWRLVGQTIPDYSARSKELKKIIL